MTVPDPTTQTWRSIVVRLVLASIVIAALTGMLTATMWHWGSRAIASEVTALPHASLQAGSNDSIPARAPESKTFVYDRAGVLAKAEAERHQFDLDRLFMAGIPTVIYIRRSNDSRSEAVTFADRLRTEWRLESAPGADDGIVMLVSLSESSPAKNSLVLSTGRHALPVGQLKPETLRAIDDREMQPAFRKNEINLALSFGVRRILYYEGYTPPDPPPLTDGQRTARSLAPVTLLAAALSTLAKPLLDRRRTLSIRWRRSFARFHRLIPVLPALLLALAGGLALYGRSAPWLVVSVLGGAALIAANRLASAWREWQGSASPALHVRPHGRRVHRPAVLAHRPPTGTRRA